MASQNIVNNLGISKLNYELHLTVDDQGLSEVTHSIQADEKKYSNTTSRYAQESPKKEFEIKGYKFQISHTL